MTKIASKLPNVYVPTERGQKPLSSGEPDHWRSLLSAVKPRDSEQRDGGRSGSQNRSMVPSQTPVNGTRPEMGGDDLVEHEQALLRQNSLASALVRTSQGEVNARTRVEVLRAGTKAQFDRTKIHLDKAQYPSPFQTLLRQYEQRELQALNPVRLPLGKATRVLAFKAGSNWPERRDNTIKTAVLYPLLLYATGYLSQLPSSNVAASLPVGQILSGHDLMDAQGNSDLIPKNKVLPQSVSNEFHSNDCCKDSLAIVDREFRGKISTMKPAKSTAKHSSARMLSRARRWPRRLWRVTLEASAAGLWVRDFRLPRRQLVDLSMSLYKVLRDKGIPIVTVTVNGQCVINAGHRQGQYYEEKM